MPSIVTTKSVAYTTQVLDKNGKPQRAKSKWNGREVEIDVVDHVRHDANVVLEIGKHIDKDTAKTLVDEGHARAHDSALDDAPAEQADPTLS